MMRLTDEEMKAISSLKMNPNFQKIISIFEKEYDVSITGLLRAKKDSFFALQGRATLLNELIKLTK